MNPSTPPKLTYGHVRGRLTLDLDAQSVTDLLTIQDTLRRESDAPTVPVSKSVAARRALRVYAESLRHLTGRLLNESGKASDNTYINKRKGVPHGPSSIR